MKNKKIRDTIKDRGLRQWQVADALGVSEATFVRRMRYELPPEEREHVLQIIKTMGGNKHE